MASLFVDAGAMTTFGISRGTTVAVVWPAQSNHVHTEREGLVIGLWTELRVAEGACVRSSSF